MEFLPGQSPSQQDVQEIARHLEGKAPKVQEPVRHVEGGSFQCTSICDI